MLKPKVKKSLFPVQLVAVLLVLFVCFQGTAISLSSQTSSKAGQIKDGIGVGEILIGLSTAADVEARHGTKYELKNRKNYSYRMDFTDSEFAFYYCYQDPKKKIFLVEVHDGVTSKGIIIGKSTVKDVVAIYGDKVGGSDFIFEYPGIQFYFEPRTEAEAKDDALAMQRKVIEVDIVAPNKASNFCD